MEDNFFFEGELSDGETLVGSAELSDATAVRGCESWFCLDLPSVFPHCCCVLSLFPSRIGCNSLERVVVRGMYRHYSVIQAGWSVFFNVLPVRSLKWEKNVSPDTWNRPSEKLLLLTSPGVLTRFPCFLLQ